MTTLKEKHAAERERQSITQRLAESGRRFQAWLGRNAVSGARMPENMTNPHLLTPAVGEKQGDVIYQDGDTLYENKSEEELAKVKAIVNEKAIEALVNEPIVDSEPVNGAYFTTPEKADEITEQLKKRAQRVRESRQEFGLGFHQPAPKRMHMYVKFAIHAMRTGYYA